MFLILAKSNPEKSHNRPNDLPQIPHNYYYFSFKIFLRFWLAKILDIIYHNQILPTIFGRTLQYVRQNCQIFEQLIEKTWERDWVVLVVSTKWRNTSLVSRGRNRQTIDSKHNKKSKRTTWRTTSALWRIFAVLNNPLSPKLADKKTIQDELNIPGAKHALACFWTRNYFEWIIKQLLMPAFILSEELWRFRRVLYSSA